MPEIIPGSSEWHEQIIEDTVDPQRLIVDPHHHLWTRPDDNDYLLPELWEDTQSGHHIEKTVYVECRSSYRTEGPEHLKPIGETEFVVQAAKDSETKDVDGGNKPYAKIRGIVAHANLCLGDAVEEVLDAHKNIAGNLFKGIRHIGARPENPSSNITWGNAPENLYLRKDFQKGMKVLGHYDLTFDAWHYHFQNKVFYELAKAVPDTLMVVDHFGTPLGIEEYKNKREEIFPLWKKDIKEIAKCDNVVAKLGGLAMYINGFGWDTRSIPPTSDEFVEAQRRYYLHTIDCFGPERCMFESNFPVDKASISYHTLWNGLKKMVADFSEDEKNSLFSGTASRVYRL